MNGRTNGACVRMRRTNGPHLHGVTVNLNVAHPLHAYFELGGVTPAHLRYADVTYGASAS